LFGIPVLGQETDYQKYHEEKLKEGVTDNQLIIYPVRKKPKMLKNTDSSLWKIRRRQKK